MCAQEKIRRKDELCAQLEADAAASEDQHHQQLTSLCSKINTLENDLQVINEEYCVREWRKIRLNLDRWVKQNFKDAAKLGQLDYNAILQSIGVTTAHPKALAGNNHQRWAILQAWIMKMLHDYIFLPYFPGLSHYDNELFLDLDQLIFEQSACKFPPKGSTNRYLGSLNTWKHCKSGINTALNTIMKPPQKGLIDELVKHVENELGEYATTASNTRQQLLHNIFSQCAEFKIMCNRQPQIYRFVSSPFGHNIDTTCMVSASGLIDCSETTVALSLWQSLWKEEPCGNSSCLEPEYIWTTAL